MKILLPLLLLSLNCVSVIPAPALTVSTCENAQNKIGKSSYFVALGIFRWGDGGITAAMNDAGIDSVHHVDIKVIDCFVAKRVTYYVIGSSRD